MSNVLFRKVESALQEELGEDAAINIGIILSIISTLLPIIQNCFGGAKATIQDGGDAAMVAVWRAVVASGYQGDRGALTLRLVGMGKASTDAEINEVMQTAAMFPR